MAKRSYTFRLLKAHVADPANALKEQHRLDEKPLTGNPENKRLFAGQAYNSPPGWISFFNAADRAQFDGLYGGQAAAILFVGIDLATEGTDPQHRWLAVCFGMGFQELRPEALESQFGLKVALNRLGRERIKSIDTRRPEDSTIQTRSQNSRIGEIFDFGVDTSSIILQAITGKSADEAFGGTLTGNDGLKLSCEVDYNGIDDKGLTIINSFNDTAYRELFPWYGKITPIRDRLRIDQLNQNLVNRLQNGEIDGIHLAPPEIIDYQNVDRFKFSGRLRADTFDDLRLHDYLALFDEEHAVTLAHLKSDKVRVANDDGPFRDQWSVFKCLCAEVQFNDQLHILASDEWYVVKDDFVAIVNAAMVEIPLSTLQLPFYTAGEKEGDYNARAATAQAGMYLYDKRLVNFEGERGRVEFCDILTDGRQLVHVKRRSKSQTLSHLFLQGQVSAEAFLDHPPLRAQIREAMPEIVELIPADRPNPADYEIVYALLHEGNPTLPFFSKVALMSISKQLRRMNYGVSLLWVGLTPDNPV
ncbi:MAG: TIGR04141 family sporadically distributed protein [Rhodospirillaceae bacterium]|nr:TIGR04141 family sporadically distributed protein [Rhodospirillaceae bacterium]